MGRMVNRVLRVVSNGFRDGPKSGLSHTPPSCSMPETVASDAARRIVFLVTGGAGLPVETELTGVFHQPRPEGDRATVRRVPDAGHPECRLGEPSDREDAAATR